MMVDLVSSHLYNICDFFVLVLQAQAASMFYVMKVGCPAEGEEIPNYYQASPSAHATSIDRLAHPHLY